MSRLLASASLLALSLARPAFADDAAADAPAGSAQHEIIVTAPYTQSEADILQGTSVVKGEELTRQLRPTIGETLARQPGVSATSFGPSASRPVLRGLQGDRVRVLTDGIGSIDVSNTSVDHAVVIDPLLAERVEVLRGPAALLFGSSAIGGVVNVIDNRIPRTIPENGYRLSGIGTYGSAANERSGSAAADVAVGKLVLHADGSYAKTDDLEIGGHVLSARARAASLSQVGLPQSPEPNEDGTPGEPIDFAGNAALRGRLPNSASKTWTAGVGAAVITEGGSLGVSYSHYDSFYGVPVRFATQVGQEQEGPRLDLAQDRFDLRGEVETGGSWLDKIRVRAGQATYRHYEVEENGDIGTTFRNNGLEGRVELVQAKRGGWQGASGVQFYNRQFDVEGEEAFLPRNETSQTGLFTLQQLDFGSFKAEGGLRYEWTRQQAKTAEDDLRYFRGTQKFGTLSGSLGVSTSPVEGVRVGLNASHTARAPSAEELFANGAHAGTQAYELGSPDFRVEKSWGLEATLHAHGDGFSFDASAYHNWFRNFIYESQVDQGVCEAAAAPSGREVDLPCFQYQQASARLYGFEADASARLAKIGSYTINADAVADYVRATVKGGGPVPRIPPLRVLGGLEAQGDLLTARAEFEHVFEQDRTADFETPTDSYTLVNASVSLRPFGKDNSTTLLLSANNLFDVTARRHASFLKDFAPLAGRDLRATIRFSI
ncbi:iron complex outermembrane receptor protein [Novosphingobium chloroacetimidivorans]|uniref:Iron complex outermembrane receptor protein n=1 Tax=Novosphingobium chloroacetimidivorans TaxID=1428314 RepID=A0A7W7K9X8_9SPHN|nr:TonB-dependent receptor [Novosphingobium chloroacetimidivorans]MBB4858298.1 iron complex outermembrane receptor protein [Novosphingobium chloroacetimidivorans]